MLLMFGHTFLGAQQQIAAYPQPEYRIKTGTDLTLISVIMVSSFTYLYWTNDDQHHFRQAAMLSPESLPAIDQGTVVIDRERADKAREASDYVAFGSMLAPMAVVLSCYEHTPALLTNGFMYAEGLALTVALTANLKTLIDRPRPLVYSDAFTRAERTSTDAWRSLPSGHTSTTAFNAFFAAALADKLLWRKEQTGWRIGTWTAAAGIPMVAGYLRMEAGKHFPTDVMAGYALGAGLGLLIPYLHTNEFAVQVYPVATGEYRGLQWQVQF